MRRTLRESEITAYCAHGQFKAAAFTVFAGATVLPVFPFPPLRVFLAAADWYRGSLGFAGWIPSLLVSF